MKIIFLFFFCSLAFAQQPTNIFAGKMTCSARRLSEEDIQIWCRSAKTNRVLINQIVTIIDFGSFEWNYSDKTPGELDATIVWSFFKTHLPGPIAYQVNVILNGIEGPVLRNQLAEATQ